MSKIFRKLFLTYILILIVCISILTPIIGVSLRNYYNERVTHELWLSSVLTKYILKEDLLKNNQADIQNKSLQIGKEINTRVTIVDKNGVVLGDSEENPQQMENHKDRSEIKDALSGKVGIVVRYSDTLKQDMMYVAIPVLENSAVKVRSFESTLDRPEVMSRQSSSVSEAIPVCTEVVSPGKPGASAAVIGVVRFALPIVSLKTNVHYIYKVILLGSLIGIFFALILSILIGNSFVKPIRQMQDITKKVTGGDFSKKIVVKSKDELGNLAYHLNQMTDELDRKIKEITKGKKELEAILGSMVEGVMVVGGDEKMLLINSPIFKMFDIRTKDIIGKSFWEVLRNEEVNSLLKDSIRNKQAVRKELHVIVPSENYFDVQTSTVFDNSSKFLGLIAVFHNITELKSIERMRAEFTANVSHELKTPLTSIKGFIETLLEGAINDKVKAKEFLNIIKTHTDRLENLINDLLSISKIESKEVKMDKININLHEELKRVVDLYKDRINEKQHIVEINIKDNAVSVFADERKLEQVFSNLLDNAIKFTPGHGGISITASEEKDYIRIDFKDNGIGIPQEHLPRIFERFYRVDRARSRELGGTGLGLSIVKHIIEAHGGKVTVDSAPGEGSTFHIFLPLP